jgi:hypothetical protein
LWAKYMIGTPGSRRMSGLLMLQTKNSGASSTES